MNFVLCFTCLVLLSTQCTSRSMPEDDEVSVVSIYTTPASAKSQHLDVYRQIADNIAERITSPIFRFFGITHNSTATSTKPKNLTKLELLDDEDIGHVDNDISKQRDVEELSVEALKRVDIKPEKITQNVEEVNSTINEVDFDGDDDMFDLDDIDDDEEEMPRSGFAYFLELVGSFVQLAVGALAAIFKPNSST